MNNEKENIPNPPISKELIAEIKASSDDFSDIAKSKKAYYSFIETVFNKKNYWLKWLIRWAVVFIVISGISLLLIIGFLFVMLGIFLFDKGPISNNFIVFLNSHEHLFMYLCTLFAVYSLLVPYFILKGILTGKEASAPNSELIGDGVSELFKGN